MAAPKNRPPTDDDLRRLLRFSPESGAIWLGEHRMVLMDTQALSALRRDLLGSVGPEHTRRLLTRMGYACGLRDAEFARRRRPDRPAEEMFQVGPQLHMLEGGARVSQISLTLNVLTGQYHGRYRWDDSWEAHAHRQLFGPAEEPVCWTLLGYASGYTSAFMGRLILFKETQCAACGADHCLIEGRPIEDWPDGEQHRTYFEDDSLLDKIEALSRQVEALTTTEPDAEAGMLVGSSPAFQQAHDLLRRAAATQVSVLLTGETGVGKERFARALHALSDRASGPFVAVNCAALPAELIEAELFGVEKGAYTGAHATRAGRFERADGGTLFLDEVGDMPLPAQAKLLRVLQEGEVERLGAEQPRKVNVRLVAATNVDLEAAVAAGRFRRDLLYRLNVYPIPIPALRERTADIAPLAQHLLQRYAAQHHKRLLGFSDRALTALQAHDWPGNVRELENLVERGVILALPGGTIDVAHLFPNFRDTDSDALDPQGRLAAAPTADERVLCERILDSGVSLDALEEQLLNLAVERAQGNLSGAARLLQMTRPQLAYRLKRRQAGEPTLAHDVEEP